MDLVARKAPVGTVLPERLQQTQRPHCSTSRFDAVSGAIRLRPVSSRNCLGATNPVPCSEDARTLGFFVLRGL